MSMATLNISLPDPLKAYVDDCVASGAYGTPSEFIRSLIRQDKEQHRSRIEAELREALGTHRLEILPGELDRPLVALLREKLRTR